MVFSDSTNNSGIVEEARWLVNANTNSYPIKELTRNANRWLDKAVSIIMSASGRWEWDDSNNTDYPIATTNLIADQQDYQLDSSHISIIRVEVKDSNGNWSTLQQIDQSDVNEALVEFESTAGTPAYYDLVSDSIFLYPKPSANVTSGLKVYFNRKASYFATTDTTKSAGFAEIFHRYISLGCAYDFALKNNSANRNQIREEMLAMEKEMVDFYSRRSKDENIRLKARRGSFK